ncbi:DUF6090 family protein [Roseivirga sp. E12]|uniref:DUF6090 family protein n=1 Tax=Roseivirga sp. E12 TaxID=2819237 RepID=UPI001ABC5251|nr:DUF6090 family protein [Roseivirga sp. E12]MBO3700257.1 hypothetical protein [Roseivirga sp. E12]
MKTKYLKYAIGEILLVVIGILIALGINNWNEQRKARIAEEKFMHRLLEDARTDSVFYESRIFGMNQSEVNYSILLAMSNNEKVDTTKFRPDYLFMFYAYQSKLVQNNPDAFEKVSDEHIAEVLRNYFGTYEFVATSIGLLRDNIETFWHPFQIEYYPLTENKNMEDAKKLLKTKKFPGIVAQVRYAVRNSRNQVDSMLVVNHNLIEALDQKLKD